MASPTVGAGSGTAESVALGSSKSGEAIFSVEGLGGGTKFFAPAKDDAATVGAATGFGAVCNLTVGGALGAREGVGVVGAGGGTAGGPDAGALREMVGAGAGGESAAPELPLSLGFALRVTRTVSFRRGTAEVFFIGLGLLPSVI